MHKFNRFMIAAAIGCASVGALAFAGCGGGSSSTTGASGASGASGGTALSQDEFVSQANAICKEVNTETEALKAPPSGGEATGFVPFITQSLAITTPQVAKLEALTPPSDLQSDWNKLISDAKARQALTQKALAAAKANDASQFETVIQQLQATKGQDDPLAESMGLTECAKDAQPQG